MEYKHLEYKKENGVAQITLDSPPLNILNIEMMREIEQILQELDAERDLKLLVLAAKGKVFCAGADVAEHHPDKVQKMMGHFDSLFYALNELQLPILAEIRGAALGGGCELALFCDIVLGSDKASFGQPEIKVGFFPPIAAVILPRLVGRNRAMEICLTGRKIYAQEAYDWGLLNHVYPEDKFEEEAAKIKTQILEASPLILRYNKRVVDMGHAIGFQRAYSQVGRTFLGELMNTLDVLEGIEAFQQKRKPEWKNQ
ncbi:enoyl-CoA hydratase/isomerase family protein [Acidobacteriota bacterium]